MYYIASFERTTICTLPPYFALFASESLLNAETKRLLLVSLRHIWYKISPETYMFIIE